MNNWEELHIGNEVNLLSGCPFDSKKFNIEKKGKPLIRIRDILDSSIDTYFSGSYLETFIIKNGDILVGMDGDFHVAKWKNIDALLNQRILKVYQKRGAKIDVNYFYYFLQPFLKKVHDITAATTVKHLSTYDITKAYQKFPKIEQQQKIAKILNTIDTVIEKTEKAITKYQNIKKGMMHDLFTRGIDVKTGQLRSSYKDAPELYKESELGMIPKDWSAEIFDEVTLKVTDRDHFTPTYFDDGIPIISPKDFDENEKISFAKCKYISLKAHLYNRKKTDLEVDDLVFTRIGAGLGKVCLVESWMPEFSILHSASMIRVKKEKMLAPFLMEYIKSDLLQRQIKVEVQSIGVPDLGLDKIKEFKVLVPKPEEQKEIIKKFESINSIIEKEIDSLKKHQKIKKGLMQDLLTGKIEVKV